MKAKRILAIVLVMTMLFSLGNVNVFANETVTISTVAELEAFRDAVNNGDTYESKTVYLTASIDLSDVANWVPIGNGVRSGTSYTGKSFKGTFDGDNNTISGLNITSSNGADYAVGLFGVVDGGTVKNVDLADVNVDVASSKLIGGAIGLMVNNATADNITVGGSVVGYDGVGGIVGRMIISGTISNCTNNADVTTTYGGIGGIVGKAYYEDSSNTRLFSSITDCTNNGTITAAQYCGGIVGLARSNVSGCVNNGLVNCSAQMVGGIVGQLIAAGNVSNNVNNAKVIGNTQVGGIIGSYSNSGYTYYDVVIDSNINYGELEASQCAAILGCNNIDGLDTIVASNNVSYYYVDGLELFGNPEDMVIDDTNKFVEEVAVLPDYVVLPDGMDASNYADLFGDNTVTDGTNYYPSLVKALEGIHLTGKDVLYCKPGADVGSMTHGHVCNDLTVYGNGAYLTSGERDFEIDTYKFCHYNQNACEGLTSDITLKVQNLNGAGAWGQRSTAYTADIIFTNCEDMSRIYLNGVSGVNNITLENCTFTSNVGGECKLYSNANGTIIVKDCSFSNLDEAINLNHKVAGVQTITVENCSFDTVGDSEVAYAAPIRVLSSVDGASSELTVNNCTFTNTVANSIGQDADILLDYGVGTTTADVSNTAAKVGVEKESDAVGYTTVASNDTVTVTNVATVSTEIEVDTWEKLVEAVADVNITTIKLTADITADGRLVVDRDLTIDLNDKTLYLTGVNNRVWKAATLTFIGGGKINCSAVSGGNIFYIGGAESGAGTAGHMILDGIEVYGDNYNTGTNAAVFMLYGPAGNSTLDIIDCKLNLSNNQGNGSVFYDTGTNCTATVNIKDSELNFDGTVRGSVCGNIIIDNSTVVIENCDNGFNEAKLTIKNNSNVSITDNSGRGITTNRNGFDVVIDNSTVILDNNGEGDIRYKSSVNIEITNSTVTKKDGSACGIVVDTGVVAKINDETVENGFAVKSENGVVTIVGAKTAVATVNGVDYETLAAAISAAADGDTVTLISDAEQVDGIIIDSKDLVIDLGGYSFKVTEGTNTNNRNFKIIGNSVVTIKNGKLVADGTYSAGAYGTVRTEGSANVTLTGLNLYNYRGNGLNIKALGNSTVAVSDTEIYSQHGGGIEAAGGEIELDNVKVYQKGMYTAPYNSMAISVNGGGKVTVNSGYYETVCLTAEEANNQGSSHGPWVAGVLNSGGTLVINGGEFKNDNYGDNSLATAARGMLLADTKANIQINGGTFNALKAVIDIQNNLGDAANNPKVELAGGTFSANPANPAYYGGNCITLADGFKVEENADGTYGVVAAWDGVTITNLAELKMFRDAVNAGDNYKGKTVVLNANIDLNNEAWTPIGTEKAQFQGTFDGQNNTISNLYINDGDLPYAGLFGYANGAKINNVKINNVDIYAYCNVGSVVGRLYTGSASNCHVSGTIKLVAQYAYAGGIAGDGYNNIYDCSVIATDRGTIKVNEKTGAGGIVGWHTEGDLGIYRCTAKNLDITAWTNLGGITGFVHYDNTIDGCTVENVTLTKTRVDGQAGIGLIAGGWSSPADDNYVITITNNTLSNITMNGTAINSHSPLYGSNYSYYDKVIKLNDGSDSDAVNTYSEIESNVKVVVNKEADLQKALAYCNEGEIIYFGSDFEVATALTATNNVTLDLNGKNVTFANGGAIQLNEMGATLAGPADLNVTTSVEGAEVVYADGVYTVVEVSKIKVVANQAELQSALDNYKAGTTIQLVENVNYGVVYLRPTPSNPATMDNVDYVFDWTGNNYGYESLSVFEDMTIIGANGAVIDAIEIEANTYYHTEHSQAETYPVMLSLIELKNVVIDGVTFTGKGGYDPQGYGNALNFSGNNIKVNGLTVKNCTFDNADDNARLMYKTESTTTVHNITINGESTTWVPTLADITITGCTFNGGYMGLELRETNNLTVTNNTFNSISSRDMLLPANSGCEYSGTITITGNTSKEAGDRFVRADGIGNAEIIIKDNAIIDYKGPDADFIKVTAATGAYSIENNTVDGKNATLVVDGSSYKVVIEEEKELFGFATVSASLDSSLALNFYLSAANVANGDYYAEVEHAKESGVVTTNIPQAEWITSGNYMVIRYTGIAAKEMADAVKITVYEADGTQASKTVETSLRAYALGMLNAYGSNSAYSKFMPVFVDMLNYGAAAQTIFGYNTDDLASAGAEDYQGYASADYTLSTEGVSSSGNALTISASLNSTIDLNAYFKNVTSDMYAIYSYTTHAGTAVEKKVEYDEFIDGYSDYNGKGVVVDLAVADAATLVNVTMYNGDGSVAGHITYSLNAYLKGMIDLGYTDAIYPALAKFAASAKAAFAK